MSLTETTSGERVHIGFFGLRNAGKSSVVNAVTGQELSVVSAHKGTTTDPVKKAMEILPLGPVVIIDTPGFDDEGDLGELRVKKTKETLSHTDVAVLIIDSTAGLSETDRILISLFEEKKIPYIKAFNKCDLIEKREEDDAIYVSAMTGEGINALKDKIAELGGREKTEKYIVADILKPNDTVVLVIPIDAAAPKGRIILPQQNVLRELLNIHCSVVCCQDTELAHTLSELKEKPALVITDSQAFERVSKQTPPDILLTSFSILFARYKGDLRKTVEAAKSLSSIKDGDRVLISEGCTHHRQCGDIGTVKMPNWVKNFTKSEPKFEFTSGGSFPDDLSCYKAVIHCGGCMLNEKEMHSRIERCEKSGVPMVNYGIAIAYMHGILKRSLEPFKEFDDIL